VGPRAGVQDIPTTTDPQKIWLTLAKQAVRNMSLGTAERLQAHGVNLNNLRNNKIVQ